MIYAVRISPAAPGAAAAAPALCPTGPTGFGRRPVKPSPTQSHLVKPSPTFNFPGEATGSRCRKPGRPRPTQSGNGQIEAKMTFCKPLRLWDLHSLSNLVKPSPTFNFPVVSVRGGPESHSGPVRERPCPPQPAFAWPNTGQYGLIRPNTAFNPSRKAGGWSKRANPQRLLAKARTVRIMHRQ
jgi:hypothetical protein